MWLSIWIVVLSGCVLAFAYLLARLAREVYHLADLLKTLIEIVQADMELVQQVMRRVLEKEPR